MHAWFQFYAVIAAAAATLLGLLFVAVSMNAAETLGVGHENSKRLAEQAFQNYLAVMVVSFLSLFPAMTDDTFGMVVLSIIAVWVVRVLARFRLAIFRHHREEQGWSGLRPHFSSVIGFGILAICAARMALGAGDDRNWFAAGTIVLLFSATLVSWELLIRIANTRHGRSRG